MFATPRGASLGEDAKDTLAFLKHWQPTVFLPQCKPAHDAAAAQAGRRGLPWALALHSVDPDNWGTVAAFGGFRQGSVLVCVSRHIREACIARGIDRPARVVPYGVRVPATETDFRATLIGDG